jgi:hypothetical protein
MLFEQFMKKHWLYPRDLTKKDLEPTVFEKTIEDGEDKIARSKIPHNKNMIVLLANLKKELYIQWYTLKAITISEWLQSSPEYEDVIMWVCIIKED